MKETRVLRQDCMDCNWFFEHEVDTKSTKDIIDVAKYLQILAGSHEGLMKHRVGRPEFRDVLEDR